MSDSIVVVGSCMIDFVSYAPRLPKRGETVRGTKFVTNFGGKGANQCVAAAKLGGRATLIARVGDDLWGEKYITNLREANVETKYVEKTPNFSSGIAQITVGGGDNQIVIVAGANNALSVQDIQNAHNDITEAGVVVMQLETAPEVAIKTMEIAKGITILNGAPGMREYDSRLLTLPTIFCVNETEASEFSGLPVTTKQEAEVAACKLINKGCNSVVLTLGADGAIYVDKNSKVTSISCPTVESVDSTGAGDAFVGALAFLLVNKNLPIEEILKSACFIATDTVTRSGTQISYPGPEILTKCT